MRWYRTHFGQAEEETAQKAGENVWGIILEQANKTPVGNHGLFLVPYLEGSLAPYWNSDAKATLLNLSVDHGKPHIMRAIAEGLAYETKKSCELMEEDMDEPVHTIISYGGASVNNIWNQILADILNKKVLVSTNPETTSLGAAMCGAAGVGIYEDVASAAKEMVMKMGEVSPDSQNAAFYDQFYTEIYKDVYDVLNDKLARGFRLAAAHASETTDA
jgi:xylulokinase